MRWVLYVSMLMTVLTAVCCVISISIPYWLYSNDPVLSYQGLWERCSPIGAQGSGNNLNCEIIQLAPEFLDATRSMMIIGLSFFVFAIICSCVYTFYKTEKTRLITATILFVLSGGILCMIGVIVYGVWYPRLLRAKGLNLHAGFGLGVISVVGAFVNTLLYCMARARGDIE